MVGLGKELVWPNLAKAACIILVVLYHAERITEASGWLHEAEISLIWNVVSMFLQPIRMPSFFLISGVLASRSIMRRDPQLIYKRLVKPMYLYAVWGCLFVFLLPAYPHIHQLDIAFLSRLEVVLLGLSPAWYLMALGVYYCVAAVTCEWNLWLTLMVCALISLTGTFLLSLAPNHMPNIARSLIFFIAGVRMRDLVLRFAASANTRVLLVTGALWLAGSVLCVLLKTFLLPVDIAAAAFAIQAVALLAARYPSLHDPARWLARRTLQVYLLHFFMLAYFAHVIKAHAGVHVLESRLLGLSAPFLGVALALPASLFAGELMKRHYLGWLFDLPKLARPLPASLVRTPRN